MIGLPSPLGEPVPVERALDHVFGLVLVNDWSARDIQAWEYQPLGPFLGKSFATSIGHWVLPLAALADRRVPAPPQEPEPLPYLREEPWAFDLPLEVELNGHVVSRTNARHLYWSVAQQVAHLTVNGAALRTGDLLASGTISGPERDAARLVHRADLERRRAARARRRHDAHVPRGRRRGRAARRGPRRGPRRRVDQRPLNSGWRFSWKAFAPSAKSAERAHSSCIATSSSSVAASAGRAEASITRLARPTATGAQASSSSISFCVSGPSFVDRRDAVDEPDPLGLVAVDHLAGHHHLLGAAEADHLRQPRGAADVGDQADPRLRHADHRVLGHHPQVAGQRELHRAADAGAVDDADRRLRHLLAEVPGVEDRLAERAQVVGVLGELAQRAEVHPGGEHRAGAADDDAVRGGVGGRGAERIADRRDEVAVEGVALVGAVEHDMADGAVLLGDDEWHCGERSSGRASDMSPRTPIGHDLLDRLASLEAVDAPAQAIAKFVRNLKRPPEINEALSGTWLGHPVHPLLIMLPMGTWTSAVLLDWLGGDDAETAADVLLGAGLAAAVPTVATGYADWADTEPASDTVRRLGIVHAACNGTAAVLFAASLAARAAGARGRGKLLALGGMGAISAGGYLGGHLTYAEGVGVNHDTFEDYPEDWTPGARRRRAGRGRDEGGRRRRRTRS